MLFQDSIDTLSLLSFVMTTWIISLSVWEDVIVPESCAVVRRRDAFRIREKAKVLLNGSMGAR